MSGHPAVILPNPGETAGAFARRQAEYTAFYKAASLEVYTRGFLIAGIVCLLAIAVALWLRRNPESGLEEGPIF
jgi:ABC-type nitrate/sulfonate/bicarbonate transport system permease component